MNVASFTIDHDRLLRGLYVSRKDNVNGNILTTFDIRIKRPNIEPPIDMPALHSLEHLMAVYLRDEALCDIAEEFIYIGPMGCRTGMYIVIKGDVSPEQFLPHLQKCFKYMMEFEGTIPATTSAECGNYLEHNLTILKYESKRYYEEVLLNMKDENMIYPGK